MAKVSEVKKKLTGKDSPEKPDENTALIPANEAEGFQMMERRDEEQIVAALEGKYLDEFVYSFQQGGKTVEGLSWVGIQEAARAYGGIQCSIANMKIEDNGKEIIVMLEAVDSQTNSSAIGVSTQAKMMKTSRGVMEDTFARQKAVAKAQRNAKRQLLPQALLRQWIDKHRAAKSGGDNGSVKILVEQFHAAWRSKGLTQEQVVEAMERKYGVKTTSLLSKEQIVELTAYVNSYQPVPEPEEKEAI